MTNIDFSDALDVTHELVELQKQWMEETNIKITGKFMTASQMSNFVFWQMCKMKDSFRNVRNRKFNEESK
jgi:hypothetical protein